MGRPRKPAALKSLAGEKTDTGPAPAEGSVSCPTNLSEGAQAVWNRLAPDLIAKRVLTLWDVDEFAAFCDAVDRRDRSADHMDREGEVIEAPVFNRNGERTGERTQLSPWWQVWKGANEAMIRFGGRFGLSPSDRAALKVDHGREQQSGEDLLTG